MFQLSARVHTLIEHVAYSLQNKNYNKFEYRVVIDHFGVVCERSLSISVGTKNSRPKHGEGKLMLIRFNFVISAPHYVNFS